jgi:hypothetical protein
MRLNLLAFRARRSMIFPRMGDNFNTGKYGFLASSRRDGAGGLSGLARVVPRDPESPLRRQPIAPRDDGRGKPPHARRAKRLLPGHWCLCRCPPPCPAIPSRKTMSTSTAHQAMLRVPLCQLRTSHMAWSLAIGVTVFYGGSSAWFSRLVPKLVESSVRYPDVMRLERESTRASSAIKTVGAEMTPAFCIVSRRSSLSKNSRARS